MYCDNVYTNIHDLNGPVDGVEREYITIISTDYLLVYINKYELQVHLDNSVCKCLNKQMLDYFDDDLFETDKD